MSESFRLLAASHSLCESLPAFCFRTLLPLSYTHIPGYAHDQKVHFSALVIFAGS